MPKQTNAAFVVPGTDVAVPLPPGRPRTHDERRAESRAIGDDPGIQRLLEEASQDLAAGKSIPAEELYRELGLPTASAGAARAARDRRTGPPSGRLSVRLPRSVHRALIDRAADEGISVNQLVLAYVSHGLGADQERINAT